MFCCAADAQPVSVHVAGTAPKAGKMDWVEVVGTVRFPETVPGKRLPEVTAEGVKPVDEPADKFLY